MTGHDSRRVSPFGHPRIEARSSSPGLFAAYDALHRLPAPRHPPYALSSLTIEKLRNDIAQRVVANALNLTIQLSKIEPLRCWGAMSSWTKPFREPRSSLPPCGGGKRIRTADPLLAKQVLCQLSYTPELSSAVGVVGLGRFELPTSPLSGVRSAN